MTESQSPHAFPVFQDLLLRYAGLHFAPEKAYLLQARLGGIMRREGCADVDQLAEKLESEPYRLGAEIADAMLNNETLFFRDRQTFADLEDHILPSLRRARSASRSLKIWSAACSTGQEAYSIAMMLHEAREQWSGWQIDILATDLSSAALAKARAGRYNQFEIQRGLSTRNLVTYFDQIGRDWQIHGHLRAAIDFAPRNLCRPFPQGERHDIILARNVLMYLDKDEKARTLARLHAALAPDGVLILGSAETLIGQTDHFLPLPDLHAFYVPRSTAAATTSSGSCPENPRTAIRRPQSWQQAPSACRKPNRVA